MSGDFQRVAVIGLGLIGSSIARGVKAYLPDVTVAGFDASEATRAESRGLGFCDVVADDAAEAVRDADLVILAVPVGRMADAARALKSGLKADAIISDVGSSKASVAEMLRRELPEHRLVPAHPVAGTENSGPSAGFASLFQDRWCIITPEERGCPIALEGVVGFWKKLGAKVEIMEAAHHDMVLAVTSHLPHLIAYTIVGTASELEEVTESEVIKYSAGGFRDFTRIAASDPVMWRDIFLNNKDAVLSTLQRFNEDLTVLQQAIRRGDGDKLEAWFSRTRGIRRSIIDEGQDDPAPDFGRRHGKE